LLQDFPAIFSPMQTTEISEMNREQISNFIMEQILDVDEEHSIETTEESLSGMVTTQSQGKMNQDGRGRDEGLKGRCLKLRKF